MYNKTSVIGYLHVGICFENFGQSISAVSYVDDNYQLKYFYSSRELNQKEFEQEIKNFSNSVGKELSRINRNLIKNIYLKVYTNDNEALKVSIEKALRYNSNDYYYNQIGQVLTHKSKFNDREKTLTSIINNGKLTIENPKDYAKIRLEIVKTNDKQHNEKSAGFIALTNAIGEAEYLRLAHPVINLKALNRSLEYIINNINGDLL